MTSHLLPNDLAPALLGLPHPSSQVMLVILGVVLGLIAAGAYVTSRPGVRIRIATARDRALGWIDRSIGAWQAEGRLTPAEADQLRSEMREPEFAAVLPHLGVHLTVGVFLRFPFGSITRAAYVLVNFVLAHARLAARRIDYATFRRQAGIHSPLVLLITCLPGVGTFAYLASKPFRAHHLLTRVALDAVLLKLPKDVYRRTGARPILTRPATTTGTDSPTSADPGLRLHIVPARLVALLGLIVVGLFALDVAAAIVDHLLDPTFLGWEPISRIVDLNAESSVGTWFATTTLLLCAVVLGVIALGKRQARDQFAFHWAGLSAVVLGLAIDEQAKLHDLGSGFGTEVRERLGLGGLLYYGWVVVAAVTLVVLAALYWRFVLALPGGTRARFFVAAGLYLAGEMGMEMVGGWIMDRNGATLAYTLATSVEEFLALLGVLVAFGTLLGEMRAAAGPVSITVAPPDGTVAAPDVTGLVIEPSTGDTRRAQPLVPTVQMRP